MDPKYTMGDSGQVLFPDSQHCSLNAHIHYSETPLLQRSLQKYNMYFLVCDYLGNSASRKTLPGLQHPVVLYTEMSI